MENNQEFDCLVITDAKVFPVKDSKTLKGLATVTLNEQLCLRGLRIYDGVNGLFVGYPQDPFYKGDDYRTMFFPCTRQLREHIENTLLEKYQQAINNETKEV